MSSILTQMSVSVQSAQYRSKKGYLEKPAHDSAHSRFGVKGLQIKVGPLFPYRPVLEGFTDARFSNSINTRTAFRFISKTIVLQCPEM